MFALNEFFGSKDQGIGRRLLHRLIAAALADSTAGATRRDARRQQAERFVEVLVYMGIGSEAFLAPEIRSQAGKERRIHIQKALDSARRAKDRGEEPSRCHRPLRGGGIQRWKRRLVISRNSACWAGMPASAKKETESREPSIDFHPC